MHTYYDEAGYRRIREEQQKTPRIQWFTLVLATTCYILAPDATIELWFLLGVSGLLDSIPALAHLALAAAQWAYSLGKRA